MTTTPHFDRLLASAGAQAIPLAASVELTGRCNLRCRHCYIPDHEASDGISTPRMLELLDELAQMGTLFLTLTGGEPTMRQDWLDLVVAARRRRFSVRLFTNATRVGEDAARTLAEHSVAAEVSFYHMDEVVFDGITGVPGSCRAARRGVEMLRRHGVEVMLKVPVMSENISGVGEVREFADAVGAEMRADPRILRRRDGDDGPLGLRAPEDALADFLSQPYADLPELAEEEWEDGSPCAAGVRSAAVTAAGDVLACPALLEPAGNVNRQSLRSIWEDSPVLHRLREVRRRDLEVCGACSQLAYCQRCPAQALGEDGDLLGPSASACAFARAVEKAHGRRG